MVKPQEQSAVVPNNFQLKNFEVELLPSRTAAAARVSIDQLEAMRDRTAIPASKHGLETICGASCETGAQ